MDHSKSNAGSNVPFPGPDALASAPMQSEEPPPLPLSAHYGPGPEFFVVGCLNCAHCRDDGYPHKPERWVCARAVDEAGEHLCYMLRNDPSMCGLQAKFYIDAITGR